MKILQTADFHLKSDNSERFDILEYIVKRAVKDNFDLMIICGDLFEDKISANKIRPEVRALFDAYSELKIILLPGNHDVDLYGEDKNYGQNVRLINKIETEEFYGWHLILIPFIKNKNFRDILQDISSPPERTLIFTHGTLYDKRFSYIHEDLGEFAEYMPIFSWDVEDRAKYLGLGHFHSKFVKDEYENTLIAYSGSPVATGKKCIGKRKYIGIELTDEFEFKFFDYTIEIASYWKNINQHVYPGTEDEILTLIEKKIEELKDSHVMVNIKISGILSCGEEKFDDLLKNVKDKYKSFFAAIEIENLTSNWENVTSNPAVKNFIKKLENYPINEEIKNKALELAIDGFSKAIT